MDNRMQRLRTLFLVVGGLILLAVVYVVLRKPEPSAPALTLTLQPLPTPDPATPTPATINVYVSGAVNKPDVYALPLGALVKDALAAAGGAAVDADLDRINLALRLSDQMQVQVPHLGEAAAATPNPRSAPAAITAPVNINTATLEQLDALPGIGPSIGQAIIDYRTANGPFKAIEDINQVKGIGDALFAKIKDSITVGP